MKKLICMLLCVIFILCGCGTASEETEPSISKSETIPTETTTSVSATESSEIVIDDSTPDNEANNVSSLSIGNIRFTLPNGFFIYTETPDSYGLMSDDRNCAIGLYATDFSSLDETSAKKMLPLQHSVFLDDEIRYDESDMNYTIAGFPVIIDIYSDISDVNNFKLKMNTSFTDSWYGYTITFTCNPGSTNIKDFSSRFGELLTYSEYVGNPPRFDYVQ